MAYGNDWVAGGWHYKRISAVKLIEILAALPAGTTVCANRVETLCVCDGGGNQFGVIDIGKESLELFVDDDDDDSTPEDSNESGGTPRKIAANAARDQ